MSSRQKAKVSIAARAVALAVVAVFCFHLSRFYLSVELCSHNIKGGYALQHCKDVAGWLTAPRAKMEEVSSPIANPVLEVIHFSVAAPADAAPDIYLPPPFHPPRFLS